MKREPDEPWGVQEERRMILLQVIKVKKKGKVNLAFINENFLLSRTNNVGSTAPFYPSPRTAHHQQDEETSCQCYVFPLEQLTGMVRF